MSDDVAQNRVHLTDKMLAELDAHDQVAHMFRVREQTDDDDDDGHEDEDEVAEQKSDVVDVDTQEATSDTAEEDAEDRDSDIECVSPPQDEERSNGMDLDDEHESTRRIRRSRWTTKLYLMLNFIDKNFFIHVQG